MQYLHTMVRVHDLDASLEFYCDKLGLVEAERMDNEKGRFTLVFLSAPEDLERAKSERAPMVELTYNSKILNGAGDAPQRETATRIVRNIAAGVSAPMVSRLGASILITSAPQSAS